MTFNKGDKIKFINTYQQYWVTKARKNATGFIEGFTTESVYKNGIPVEEPHLLIKLNNGTLLSVPANGNYVALYEKPVRVSIQDLPNKELVERFARLTAQETTKLNMRTKAYEKLVADISKLEEELLRRLEK